MYVSKIEGWILFKSSMYFNSHAISVACELSIAVSISMAFPHARSLVCWLPLGQHIRLSVENVECLLRGPGAPGDNYDCGAWGAAATPNSAADDSRDRRAGVIESWN